MLYEFYREHIISGSNRSEIVGIKNNMANTDHDRAYPCSCNADLDKYISKTGVSISEIENIDVILIRQSSDKNRII